MIDLIATIGILLAVLGSILGLIGAWGTSSKDRTIRHLGFTLWLLNSPMIVISLAGIAAGIWTGYNAGFFVPLNLVYWGTAYRGWRNTLPKEENLEIPESLRAWIDRPDLGNLSREEWI